MNREKREKPLVVKFEDIPKQEPKDYLKVKLEEETTSTYSLQSHDRNSLTNDNVSQSHAVISQKKKPDTKHIIKNYGKGMCTFACSDMAKPYLQKIILNKPVKVQEFQSYIKKQRKTIDSMKSIRDLLLVTEKDTAKMKAYKEIFQEISVVFIKFFSVNWVFHGKMTFKRAHLNVRFKMLRRIQHPEHFTYFKDFTKYI